MKMCSSLLLFATCPSLSSISFTLSSNAWVCLLHRAVLHPDTNTAHHVVSLSLIDLNSSLIPCDEQDEAEEETYDDIEGVSGPPLPRPGAGQAPPSGNRGGVPNMWEDEDEEEEDEDIYEVLPGAE